MDNLEQQEKKNTKDFWPMIKAFLPAFCLAGTGWLCVYAPFMYLHYLVNPVIGQKPFIFKYLAFTFCFGGVFTTGLIYWFISLLPRERGEEK